MENVYVIRAKKGLLSEDIIGKIPLVPIYRRQLS